MKKRIYTAIVGLALIIFCLFKIDTIIFVLLFSLISAIASFEVIRTTGIKNKFIYIISIIYSAIIPFIFTYTPEYISMNIAVFSALLFISVIVFSLLKLHKTIKFEQICVSFYGTLFVPFCLSHLIKIGNCKDFISSSLTKNLGIYLAVFAFMCSWLTDAFAYFVGRKLGKHKLCPNISPNKSIEGAIGGFVLNVIFNIIVYIIIDKFIFSLENISILFVIIMSAILSVLGMIGDLSASLIKRNFNIKDFGNLMPGHGGVMDRFDSCIFVFPILYYSLVFYLS